MAKAQVLSKTFLGEKVEYSFDVDNDVKSRVSENIRDVIEEVFPSVLTKYIIENKRYELKDYDYDTGEYEIEGYDYNITDYKTLEDFMDTQTDKIDSYNDDLEYVGEALVSQIENIVGDRIRDSITQIYDNILPVECCLIHKSEKKYELTKQFKKRIGTENFYDRKSTRIYDVVEFLGEEKFKDYIQESLSKRLDKIESDVWDYINEISDESFVDIYKTGCEQLNIPSPFKKIKFEGTDVENFILGVIKESVTSETACDGDFKNLFLEGYHFDLYESNNIIEKNDYVVEFIDADSNELLKTICCAKILELKCSPIEMEKYCEVLSSIYAHELFINASIDENIEYSVSYLKDIFRFSETRDLLLRVGVVNIIKFYYEKIRIKHDIKDVLPKQPKEYYPLARTMKRKFVLHIGDTNTGKTYESLEKLGNAKTGVYLAPLRLLALEVQDKLYSKGVKCSLLTGEEEIRVDGETHISSTIEKLDFGRTYEVAVIDEAQMLEDISRGAAWSSAIMGVCAEEVHICMSSFAKDVVVDLINYCGDEYEIINHTRDTELEVVEGKFNFLKDLQKGDALVVFSKRKVLNVAAKIKKDTSFNPSVLYGALPYTSRKKQFEAFLNGETDVLVCTDAIGMGINAPIKRVIFLEDKKYDGISNRKLLKPEIRQISGRAGRRGIYEHGTVIGSKDIVEGMKGEIKNIKNVFVGLSPELLSIQGEFRDIMKAWELIKFPEPFRKSSLISQYEILNIIEVNNIDLTKEQLYRVMFLPVDTKSTYMIRLLTKYCRGISMNDEEIDFPSKPQIEYDDELKQLEDYYKAIDLYYSFNKAFDLTFDKIKVDKERELTASKINTILVKESLRTVSKCSRCGKELPWDHIRYKCDDCYNSYGYGGYSYYGGYSDWGDDWDNDEW